MAKIFVVGYSGSGTRVIQQIAQRAGLNIGREEDLNQALDLQSTSRHMLALGNIFDPKIHTEIREDLKETVGESTRGTKDWCIKNGEFLFTTEHLRATWPNLKTILVVRNGHDNILNSFVTEERYPTETFPGFAPEIKEDAYESEAVERMQLRAFLWQKWNMQYMFAASYAPMSSTYVRLEDIIANPQRTIAGILKFLEVDDNPDKYLDLIERPESIGRRFKKGAFSPIGEYDPEEHGFIISQIMGRGLAEFQYPQHDFCHQPASFRKYRPCKLEMKRETYPPVFDDLTPLEGWSQDQSCKKS